MDDFNQMPANNLIQVLMMEMKMTVNASGYLISGYPRSMRDVVEYTEKVSSFSYMLEIGFLKFNVSASACGQSDSTQLARQNP